MKKIINLTMVIFFLLSISLNVNATGFGVTQPNSVFIQPGQSKIMEFSVQTGAGDTEDVLATLEVKEGNNLVELIEPTEYIVPASGETKARIKINMPENAKPEDSWNVVLEFKARPINKETGKMITLGYGVEIRFKVGVEETVQPIQIPTGQVAKETNYNSKIIAPIIVVLVAVVVTFLIARRKPKNKIRKTSKRKK